MFADGALTGDEAETVNTHLSTCSDCQARVDEFNKESQMIRQALGVEETVTVPQMPKFSKPLSLRGFAMVNVMTGLVVWSGQFLWKTLFGELIVEAATQVTAIYIPDVYELSVNTALYFIEEGTTMIDTYLGYIILGLLALTLSWVAVYYRRARATVSAGLLVVFCAGLLAPEEVNALEFRRDEGNISIAEGETIDDSLVLAGETIMVNGQVNGDVVAAGRRIVVNGKVDGNLFAFGESITVRGEVGGLTLSAGSAIELEDAVVGGDLVGAGAAIRVGGDSKVGRNAIMAGDVAIVDGSIQRDLFAFSENVELTGSIGEDLEAFAARVNLFGDARVGGNLRFRTRDEDRLHRSPESVVEGEVEFVSLPEEFTPRNRYLHVEFYIWQLMSLLAAFVFGIALLWLIPDMRYARLDGGLDGLKTAGIGLVTLISLPIISFLVAFTLIGIPFTIVGFFLWFFVIYSAKIVLGSMIGQMVLAGADRDDSLVLTLLVGLALISIAVNIPAIGGIISFLLTIVGIGMIVQLVLGYLSDVSSEGVAE